MGPVISPHAGQPRPDLLRARRRTRARSWSPAASGSPTASSPPATSSRRPSSTGVRQDMHLAQEEVFGPVLAVIPFDDRGRGRRRRQLARSTVWPRRSGRTTSSAPTRLARRLQAGNVSINYPTVNPPEAPFGGYKQSGLGRELSRHAMDLYTQTKNVVVNLNPAAVRLVRPLARGAKAVVRRSPAVFTPRLGSTVAGRRASGRSLRRRALTATLQDDPASGFHPRRSGCAFPGTHHLRCLPSLPSSPSSPTSVRSSKTRRQD